MQQTEPLQDRSDERDAIRTAIEDTDLYILTYYGGDNMVALVKRDSQPPAEFPRKGEKIVLVEWPNNEDYGLSTATGKSNGWELQNTVIEIVDTRKEAIEAVEYLFNNE